MMIKQYCIRETTIDDRQAVSNLLAACYPVLMPSAYPETILKAALPMMVTANPKLLSSHTFYVAQNEDEALMGCGGWTFERPGTTEIETGLAHIRHFAVDPVWTGSGIGRALYHRCQEEALSAGADRFECYSSLNAEGFYASLGFQTIERIDVPMGTGIVLPSLRMTRSL